MQLPSKKGELGSTASSGSQQTTRQDRYQQQTVGGSEAKERKAAEPRLGLAFYSIVAAILLGLLIAAYEWQARQPLCESANGVSGWLFCPQESNSYLGSSDTASKYTKMYFTPDARMGMAAGAGSTILRSADGGKTWLAHQVPGVTQVHALSISPTQDVWLVAGKGSARSSDGLNWKTDNSLHGEIAAVQFSLDGKRGWAIGPKSIQLTQDGGKTWKEEAFSSSFIDYVGAMSSIAIHSDGMHGLIGTSSGMLFQTSNGGVAWVAASVKSEVRIVATGADVAWRSLWALDSSGELFLSSDGGVAWRSGGKVPGHVTIRTAFANADVSKVRAVAEDGAIYSYSRNAEWKAYGIKEKRFITSAYFTPDLMHGWLLSSGKIFYSEDGGISWTPNSYERAPARWYYIVAFLLICLAVFCVLIVWSDRKKHKVIDTLGVEATSDKPLERAEQDLLGFSIIAEALSYFLRHEKTQPSLTVSITAAWGRGKSSLMRLLRRRLIMAGGRVVWFNAWHHQKEPVMLAALLGVVTEQAVPRWFSYQGIRFRLRLILKRLKRRPLRGVLALTVFICGILIMIYMSLLALWWMGSVGISLVTDDTPELNGRVIEAGGLLWKSLRDVIDSPPVQSLMSAEWSAFVRETIGLTGTDLPAFAKLVTALLLFSGVYLLLTYFSRAFPARPGALLFSSGNRFNLAQAEDQTTLRQRFRENFEDVTWALKPRTLTIFIDDIDRCTPANAAEMLEACNYLIEAGQCFVIFGMAREVVEAQLADHFAGVADQAAEMENVKLALSAGGPVPAPIDKAQARLRYARNYLKKLIQIDVPVPRFGNTQMQAMLQLPSSASNQELKQRLAAYQALERTHQRTRQFVRWSSTALALAIIGSLAAQVFLYTTQQEKQTLVRLNELTQLKDALPLQRKYVNHLRINVEQLKAAAEQRVKRGAESDPSAQRELEHTLTMFQQAEHDFLIVEKRIDAVTEGMKKFADVELFEKAKNASAEFEKRYRSSAQSAYVSQSGVVSQGSASVVALTGVPITVPRTRGAVVESDEPKQSMLPLVLPVLLLAFCWLYVRRWCGDDYEIQDTDSYKEAFEHWRLVLVETSTLQAPREVRRFLNLSRYITLRANSHRYAPLSWWRAFQIKWNEKGRRFIWQTWQQDKKTGDDKQLDERKVVALTALMVSRPQGIRHDQVHQYLCNPDQVLQSQGQLGNAYASAVQDALAKSVNYSWDAADVEYFLEYAGELHHV